MKKIILLGIFCILSYVLVSCGSNGEVITTETEIETEIETEVNSGNTEDETSESNTDSDFVDLTTLSSTMVYAEVYAMVSYPEDYIGKTVKIQGEYIILQDDTGENIYSACIIYDAMACCAQGIEFVLGNGAVYPDDYPELNSEITVTGTFETYDENGITYIHLVEATLE